MLRMFKRRDVACVPLALRAMFGTYEHQEELEELLEELMDSEEGITHENVRIIEEYVPVFFFDAPRFDFNGHQDSFYATFVDCTTGVRYRIPRHAHIITVYKSKDWHTAHAECIVASSFPVYLHDAHEGKLELNYTILPRTGLIIDRTTRSCDSYYDD